MIMWFDESICVAVSLCLGINLCKPHVCLWIPGRCMGVGGWVGNLFQVVCSRPVSMAWHVNLHLATEPNTSRSMRLLVGLLLLLAFQVVWQEVMPNIWTVGLCSTAVWQAADMVQLHLTFNGAAAKLAAFRNSAEYGNLLQSYLFQPHAVEMLGSMDSSTVTSSLIWGATISSVPGDAREAFIWFQHISITRIALQLDALARKFHFQWWHRGLATPALLLLAFVFSSRDLYYRG